MAKLGLLIFISSVAGGGLAGAQSAPRVYAGSSTSFIISGDGTLFRAGLNGSRQLGTGDSLTRRMMVSAPAVAGAASIAPSGNFTYMLKTDGSLWACGSGNSGVIPGLPFSSSQPFFAPVAIGDEWAEIRAGTNHLLARKTEGTLWAWGANHLGQLGQGNTQSLEGVQRVGTDSDWTALSVREDTNHGLRSGGVVWRWGRYFTTTPVALSTAHAWVQVSVGVDNALAIRADGTLWAWGSNAYGQLGQGNNNSSTIPLQVGTLNDWMQVQAGTHYSLAIRGDGSLWAFGRNDRGQLGLGDKTGRNTPVRVGTDSFWLSVSAGSAHALGVKTDHSVWGWGNNENNPLGIPASEAILPTLLDLTPRAEMVATSTSNGEIGTVVQVFPVTVIGLPTQRVVRLWSTGSIPVLVQSISVPSGIVHDQSLPLEIPPGEFREFKLVTTAAAAANINGDLVFHGNAADTTVKVSARVLSFNEDSDQDGLSDAAEWHLSEFGFDWSSTQTALVAALLDHGHFAGVETEAAFLHGDGKSATAKWDAGSGLAKFRLRLEQGGSPGNLGPAPITGAEVGPEDGKVRIPVAAPDGNFFYRFALEPPPPES